jgi:hypothetical protein
MKTLKEMSKDERSLLLFFESACTERGGTFNPQHMNDNDRNIADKWKEEGFIDHGRICSDYIRKNPGFKNILWVLLGDEAWDLAHQERKARCQRLYDQRVWVKTSEL